MQLSPHFKPTAQKPVAVRVPISQNLVQLLTDHAFNLEITVEGKLANTAINKQDIPWPDLLGTGKFERTLGLMLRDALSSKPLVGMTKLGMSALGKTHLPQLFHPSKVHFTQKPFLQHW